MDDKDSKVWNLFKTSDPIVSDDQNLEFVRSHCASLFSPPEDISQAVAEARMETLGCRSKVIPLQESSLADSPLSLADILQAIENLKPNKTPGLDGLPSEFFQQFKDLLAPLLLAFWEESFFHKALPCSINACVIKLLHKRGAKDDISNWRPLTMHNSAYKIFGKAVANQICVLFMKWISKEQKGFIKGRRLVEAVVSLWEGFDHATESGQDFVFVKIDFDKAYDRLEWSFILRCMEAMGFGERMILFIQTLMGNARARISLNGGLSEVFVLSRSVDCH